MDPSVQAVRLNEDEADKLRAAGHAIPKVTRLEKRSDLSLEDRLYVVKRLYTLRTLLLPFMMRVFPDQDPMDMLRDVLRSQYEEDNDVDIPLPLTIVNLMKDKRGLTDRFMPLTYGVYDGRAVDGEFHSIFMMITSELTSKAFIQALTKNITLEIEEGSEVATARWKDLVAPRLAEGGDLFLAGAEEAERIRQFEMQLVKEAKKMVTENKGTEDEG